MIGTPDIEKERMRSYDIEIESMRSYDIEKECMRSSDQQIDLACFCGLANMGAEDSAVEYFFTSSSSSYFSFESCHLKPG